MSCPWKCLFMVFCSSGFVTLGWRPDHPESIILLRYACDFLWVPSGSKSHVFSRRVFTKQTKKIFKGQQWAKTWSDPQNGSTIMEHPETVCFGDDRRITFWQTKTGNLNQMVSTGTSTWPSDSTHVLVSILGPQVWPTAQSKIHQGSERQTAAHSGWVVWRCDRTCQGPGLRELPTIIGISTQV